MAPDFTLPCQSGDLVSLSNYSGKWRVVYFYPRDGTPICTQEACHFRDDYSTLQGLNAEVIGINAESHASHDRFSGRHRLPFNLLSDKSAATLLAYGALWDFGLFKMAKRYTFIIDPEGRIAARFLSVNTARHSRDVIETLERLQRMAG